MAMNAIYTTIHIQLQGSSSEDALSAAKAARGYGLQVTLTDGLEGVPPSLIVDAEVTADNSQEIFDAVKAVQKFLIDTTDVH